MIRKFRIKGLTTGIILDLTDFNKFLLTNPSGLGIALNNEYIRILNKRINIKQEKNYKPITATIEVTGQTRSDWEWNYAELRDFIIANRKDGFALYYSAIEGKERYVICDVKILDKSEKSSYGLLIPIELEVRTNWLEDRQVNVEVVTSEEKGLGFYKEYITHTFDAYYDIYEPFDEPIEDYNYGFLYDDGVDDYNYKFIQGIRGRAEITNSGNDITPLIITITSECNSPLIRLYDTNNNVVQTCKVNVSVDEGEKLVINSDPDNLDIYVLSSTGVKTSAINLLDLSTDGFINLPVGTYTLTIEDELQDNIGGYVNFTLQYLGG